MPDAETSRKSLREAEISVSSLNPNWKCLAVVLAATFLAYARTLNFEFVYDDAMQIVGNPFVHAWRFVPRYFTEHAWAGVSPGYAGNYYRPVFLLWCRLNDALFGNQAGLWHLTTVAVHLTATALVYFLALRLLKDRFAAGTAALIFGLHPAHIESVAWVSGVTDPLLAFFFIASFLCFLIGREGKVGGIRWLTLSLVFYALGMLEKETALMLPAVIASYEWIYGKAATSESARKAWLARGLKAARAAAPFVLLTLPYLVARVVALKGFSHPPAGALPVLQVVFTWPSLIWFWIAHLVVPFGLASCYEIGAVVHPGVTNFILPGLGVLATGAVLVWAVKRSREAAFATVWLVVPLLPVLDIRIFSPHDFAHDRYLYLPSVGLAILGALALRTLGVKRVSWRGIPIVQISSAILVVLILGIGTAAQSFYFKNNGVFYTYNFLAAPHNLVAETNYAAYLGNQGRYAESAKLLEGVLADNTDDARVHANLGHDYYELGRLPEAVQFLERAAELDSNAPDTYLGLGMARLRLKQYHKSEAAFRQAIALQPDGYGFHFALGLVLKEQGQIAEARVEFQKEWALHPENEAAKRELAGLGQAGSATR